MKCVEGAEHVPAKELDGMRTRMGQFLDTMAHKPYLRLKKMEMHKWGAMRAWPKWKSLKKIWSKPDDEGKKSWDQSMEEAEEVMKGVGGGRRSEE